MRKHSLGAAAHSGSWSPRFKIAAERKPNTGKTGRKNTPFMSWFPTVKGEPRMEGLRHYFHKDMAMILDARPCVVAWTADTAPIRFEGSSGVLEFMPDFRVDEEDRTYWLRLLPPDTTRSEATAERHGAADDAYRSRGESLTVMTAEEVAAHPQLPTAREVFLNRGRDWPEELPGAVADTWGDDCPTTLGDIHASTGGGREAWLQLLSLVSLGHVLIDMDSGLDADTPVLACRLWGYRR